MELVRAPGPHVGHRAGHLGGEEAAHYGGHVEVMWRSQRLHRPAHGVPEAARHAAPVLGRVAVVDQRVPAVRAVRATYSWARPA